MGLESDGQPSQIGRTTAETQAGRPILHQSSVDQIDGHLIAAWHGQQICPFQIAVRDLRGMHVSEEAAQADGAARRLAQPLFQRLVSQPPAVEMQVFGPRNPLGCKVTGAEEPTIAGIEHRQRTGRGDLACAVALAQEPAAHGPAAAKPAQSDFHQPRGRNCL